MFKWLKTLIRIVRTYDREQEQVRKDLAKRKAEVEQAGHELVALLHLIREQTEVHADLNFHGPNTVIVIGHYKHHDFIQSYRLHDGPFSFVIDELAALAEKARPGVIDAPPTFNSIITDRLPRR